MKPGEQRQTPMMPTGAKPVPKPMPMEQKPLERVKFEKPQTTLKPVKFEKPQTLTQKEQKSFNVLGMDVPMGKVKKTEVPAPTEKQPVAKKQVETKKPETNPIYTMLMGDDESAPVSIKNVLSVTDDTVEGNFPNGTQFTVKDNGSDLEFKVVNGPQGDEEVQVFSYEDVQNMFDMMNQLGMEKPFDKKNPKQFELEAIQETLSNWEREGKDYRESDLLKLSKRFEVPMEDVMKLVNGEITADGKPVAQPQGEEVAQGEVQDFIDNITNDYSIKKLKQLYNYNDNPNRDIAEEGQSLWEQLGETLGTEDEDEIGEAWEQAFRQIFKL